MNFLISNKIDRKFKCFEIVIFVILCYKESGMENKVREKQWQKCLSLLKEIIDQSILISWRARIEEYIKQ